MRVEIGWDDQVVSGVQEGDGAVGILVAHGAGTDQHHPSITALRSGLAAAGHAVMSFNYPYTERGAKAPDRQEKLLACHRAAADVLAAEVEAMYLAGRSMGGRMGTYLAADGYPVVGLILYAYPLHPPGKPDRLRVDQFDDIEIPMLFFQGTRDSLARMDLFDEHIRPLPNAEVVVLEGAGHGYRGGGWDLVSITERYVAGSIEFIERISSGRRV